MNTSLRSNEMPYDAALLKAWSDLQAVRGDGQFSVDLIGDTYEINVAERSVLSLSCNVRAETHVVLLILHFLIGEAKKKYEPSGEWISFKDVPGGESYYPAFRKSVIQTLIRKFGDSPGALQTSLERVKGRSMSEGDAGVEVETFKGVFVRVIVWGGDEEFGPDATVVFDRSLAGIYSMEDIVVFLHYIARHL